MAEEKKASGPVGDERLVKSTSREDRSSADAERVNKDGTALTIEERRRIMRQEWTQDVLPTPPKTTPSFLPACKYVQGSLQKCGGPFLSQIP